MGRTVEGRSELAELADDSASSAHATITSSPRRARSMTERQLFLYASSGEAVEQLAHKMQDSRMNKRVHTRNDTDYKATQKSAARPSRELRDHAERRKTTTEYGPC